MGRRRRLPGRPVPDVLDLARTQRAGRGHPDVRRSEYDFYADAGEEFQFTESLSGLRRAELEGQLDKFDADPNRLAYLAESYHNRFPQRPQIDQIRIVIEWIELHNGRPTGNTSTEEVVSWQR